MGARMHSLVQYISSSVLVQMAKGSPKNTKRIRQIQYNIIRNEQINQYVQYPIYSGEGAVQNIREILQNAFLYIFIL